MSGLAAAARAREPFRFCTAFVLQEPTGLRAATLPQLVSLLARVPDACIYHHTHYFLLSHHYLTPEPTNDFAYWVNEVLGEHALGERLAGLDIMAYGSLADLRAVLVRTIGDHLSGTPSARLRFAAEGEEFFFIKALHVVMATRHKASTLAEFAGALSQVSAHAVYYHMFDARLRLGRSSNDFTRWLANGLGLPDLAEEIAGMDPYGQSLEALRSSLLSVVQRELDS